MSSLLLYTNLVIPRNKTHFVFMFPSSCLTEMRLKLDGDYQSWEYSIINIQTKK